jgi:serine/threonine-protein kinase
LGIHHIDQRSDIFSLGIVACELLTGQRPFSGASITSIVKSQKIQRSRITMEKFTKLPLDIRNIISKMLKNNPDERYQNAADIITDLANISVS